MRIRTVAPMEAVVSVLEDEGVRVAFGVPGAAILPLYQALSRSRRIRHLSVRHEEGGTHAADGWARVTGHPGICIGTSGPAGTNMITGLYTALADSVPIICITGQAPTAMLHKEAFQAVDIVAIATPVTKWAVQVREPAQLPWIFREAFRIARSGRSGPVLIDLPLDVQRAAPIPYEPAVDASLPVSPTLMGKGAIRADHPLWAGTVGIQTSHPFANQLFLESDLVLAVGARFGDRHTGALDVYRGDRRFIQIDISPEQIGRVFAPDLGIVGDARLALEALHAAATRPQRRRVTARMGRPPRRAARDENPHDRVRRDPDSRATRVSRAQRVPRRGCDRRHRDRALPDLRRAVPERIPSPSLPVLWAGGAARLGSVSVHGREARAPRQYRRRDRRRLLVSVPRRGGRGRRAVRRPVRRRDAQQRLHGA